jgi:hypothetical protein
MDHRLFRAALNPSLGHAFDVAARAERAPGTRQHDRSDGRVGLCIVSWLAQLAQAATRVTLFHALGAELVKVPSADIGLG